MTKFKPDGDNRGKTPGPRPEREASTAGIGSPNPNWALADSFTLEQAAYLWCGQEPRRISFLGEVKPDTPPDVAAVFAALHNAVSLGTLAVSGGLPGLQDFSHSVATRADLLDLGKAKKLFPAFLFDTITPATEKNDEQPAENLTAKAPRGRPPEHDWNSMHGEIVRLADLDGLPETQAELMAHLRNWFSERYDTEPQQSELYRRVSPIWQYVQGEKARGNKR
jgi:hypothetical protein